MHNSRCLIEWRWYDNWFRWSEIWKIFILSSMERKVEEGCAIEGVDLYTNRRLITYKSSALICIPEGRWASLNEELCAATNCRCKNSAVSVKASYYSWSVDRLAKATSWYLKCARGVNLCHFLKGWALNGLGELAIIDVTIAKLKTEAIFWWVIDYRIRSWVKILCWFLLLLLHIKWGWVYSAMY